METMTLLIADCSDDFRNALARLYRGNTAFSAAEPGERFWSFSTEKCRTWW